MENFDLVDALQGIVGEDELAETLRYVREQRRRMQEAREKRGPLPEGFKRWSDLSEAELCRLIG